MRRGRAVGRGVDAACMGVLGGDVAGCAAWAWAVGAVWNFDWRAK